MNRESTPELNGVSLSVSDEEIVRLYLLLKRDELELDRKLLGLLGRIESILYERLSIEEIERLPQVYEKTVRTNKRT